MPFDATSFRARRRREVTLSDGTVCVLRPPSMERAARRDDLPAISEKLAHEIAELAPLIKRMDVAEMKARMLQNASYADLYNNTLALICDAVTEPMRFILDRDAEQADATPPRIWAGWLADDDVNTLSLAIAEMLGMDAEGLATVAPFRVPDAPSAAGTGMESAPEQPVAESAPLIAGPAMYEFNAAVGGVYNASGERESKPGIAACTAGRAEGTE
jgi:hypothetical protein